MSGEDGIACAVITRRPLPAAAAGETPAPAWVSDCLTRQVARSKYADHESARTASSGNHSTPVSSLAPPMRKASARCEKCAVASTVVDSPARTPLGRWFGSAKETVKESSRAGLAKLSWPSTARLVVARLPSLRLSVRVRNPAVIWADPALVVKAGSPGRLNLASRSPPWARRAAAQQKQRTSSARRGQDRRPNDAH